MLANEQMIIPVNNPIVSVRDRSRPTQKHNEHPNRKQSHIASPPFDSERSGVRLRVSLCALRDDKELFAVALDGHGRK